MAARSFAGDSGGTARQAARLFVGDSGGTARLVQRMFVGDSGGNARLVYVGAVISFSNQTITDNTSGVSSASYTLDRATAQAVATRQTGGVTNLETFVTPTTATSLLEAQAVYVSGDAPSGSALSTYFDLASVSPIWGIGAFFATKSVVLDVTIRFKVSPSNFLTKRITLTANG